MRIDEDPVQRKKNSIASSSSSESSENLSNRNNEEGQIQQKVLQVKERKIEPENWESFAARSPELIS